MLQSTLAKIIRVFDTYGLFGLAFFLLVFIPLYPKLPLAEVIPGYLVKVRLEDILVFLTGVIWLIQSFRGKIAWRTPFIGLVSVYGVIGLLSILSGMFLLQTIPLEPLHVGKSVFHLVRYLEYFAVFCFMFSGVTNRRQARLVMATLSIVVIVATIYGIGQKYAAWPVFSTMNREFSKGALLSLGENARVQSTFAGHYDMAAFLVILLPILLMVARYHRALVVKMWFGLVAMGGAWLLWLSGSKVAFAAAGVGVGVAWLLSVRHRPKLVRTVLAVVGVGFSLAMILLAAILLNPQDTRFISLLESTQQLPVISNVPPITRVLDKGVRVLTQRQTILTKPVDVTDSNQNEQFSDNALKYGLSLGIRLDTLWPQAFKGWTRNLLLGSGYGTLNKTGNSNFVEADSTDNNWLRIIGETGVLGFISFGAILVCLYAIAQLSYNSPDWLVKSVGLGMIGAIIGLLIDGLMIDVFVASKVAFTFWALAGLLTKLVMLDQPLAVKQLERKITSSVAQHGRWHWPILVGCIGLVLVLHRNPLVIESQITNFRADPSATAALTTIQCWKDGQGWELCRPQTSNTSPTSYLYGGYLLIWQLIWNNLGVYYYANLSLALIGMVGLYLWSRKGGLKSTTIISLLSIYTASLFLSSQVYVPVDANLTAVVWLITGYCWWHAFRSRSTSHWLSAILFLLISLHLGLALRPSDYVFSLVPVTLIGLTLALHTKSKWMLLTSINGQTTISAALLLIGVGVLSLSPSAQNLVTEFRGLGSAWPIQSVRVANDYFSDKQTTDTATENRPFLLTLANPYFFDFYSNGTYQLLPLSSHQAFMSQPTKVWGEYDFTSIPKLAQQLLDRGSSVFMSDMDLAASNQTESEPSLTQLLSQFDLKLVTFGCNDVCNLYQLQTVSKAVARTVARDKQSYNFVVYNHHYDPSDTRFVRTLQQLRTGLDSQSAGDVDFLITSGTKTQLQTLPATSGYSQPLPVFLATDSREKSTGNEFLQLVTPHDAVIFLTPNHDGYVSETQLMAVSNALFDIEQDTSIKNIFIISHRLSWLGDSNRYESLANLTSHPTLTEFDTTFQKKILPRLRRLTDRNIFVVSGDLSQVPPERPALFYDQNQVDGITYIASAVNGLTNDVYLNINISEAGQATVTAYSALTQSFIQPQEFGVEYWRSALPEINTSNIPPVPSHPVSASWVLMAVTVAAAGGLVGFARYQPNQLQKLRRGLRRIIVILFTTET